MPADRFKRIFSKTILDSRRDSRMSSLDDSARAELTPTAPAEAGASAAAAPVDQIRLPILGMRSVAAHQQILLFGLGVALVVICLVAIVAFGIPHSSAPQVGTIVLAGVVVAALCAVGLSRLQREQGSNRQTLADAQMAHVERSQQDAKRVNDANQAAILRLMNELQTVAEGDLTQQATVTEDITGAIADSVNYTVEELRHLVASVQNTASQVAQTTSEVDATSTEFASRLRVENRCC